MAKVQLENVRKVYDNGQVAVHGASFEVADGELMVLVGPSGCGKSTLLRLIAGRGGITDRTRCRGGRGAGGTVGRDAILARFPREMSGGRRRRVGGGRAVVREPAVFLLDEPLS